MLKIDTYFRLCALELFKDLKLKARQVIIAKQMQANRVVGNIAHQLATKHEIWQYSMRRVQIEEKKNLVKVILLNLTIVNQLTSLVKT